MSDIVQFPQSRSARILKLRQQESRRVAFLASVSAVIGLLIFAQTRIETHQNKELYAMRYQSTPTHADSGRAIASTSPNDSGSELAKTEAIAVGLNQIGDRKPSSMGQACQGILCDLGPNYRIVYKNGFKGAALEGALDEGRHGIPAADAEKILNSLKGKASVNFQFHKAANADEVVPQESSRGISSRESIKVWELKLTEDGPSRGIAVMSIHDDEIESLVLCDQSTGNVDALQCLSQIQR